MHPSSTEQRNAMTTGDDGNDVRAEYLVDNALHLSEGGQRQVRSNE